MTLDAIFQSFRVDLDFDSKHGSVAGQALDYVLRLVAPELRHKQWNYYEYLATYLKDNGVYQALFQYKDNRFGCLSRATGVSVFLLSWIEDFL